MTDDPIYFYSQVEAFSEFSNFAPFGIAMEGLWWPTVEHYFQAQKFHDAEWREKIRRASGPKEAKRLGMTRKLPLRQDWEEVKEAIMLSAVRAKFSTHPDLRELLVSTGTRPLVEAAPMDGYWGSGPDGTGLNRLGHILMEVRARLSTRGEVIPN